MARVLLAETNRAVRELVGGILSDFGHEVNFCASRAEADACLVAMPVDIVVTDLILQGKEGLGLGLRCFALGIPAITLSGAEFRPGVARQEQLPPLFDKPFRFADLQNVVDAVARRYAASAAARPGTRTAA